MDLIFQKEAREMVKNLKVKLEQLYEDLNKIKLVLA
jgi:hypothetical protein